MKSMEKNKCPKCDGVEFAEGTDFMSVKPVDKKFSMGSNKIYTFCLNCGEVISIRIETPAIFRK
jgi:predicted nucleic-acid-binding Zn-ribbon protein